MLNRATSQFLDSEYQKALVEADGLTMEATIDYVKRAMASAYLLASAMENDLIPENQRPVIH